MLTRANRVRPPPDDRPKNKLLAALPSEDFKRLATPRADDSHRGQTDRSSGQRARLEQCFLNDGVASMTNGHDEWRESVRLNHSERCS